MQLLFMIYWDFFIEELQRIHRPFYFLKTAYVMLQSSLKTFELFKFMH